LEESLGLKLLERTQSGAAPTEFGKIYYEQAKIIESDLQKLESLVSDYKLTQHKRIRIGTLDKQKFFYGVDSCVKAYKKEFPDTTLEISAKVFDSSAELFDSIRAGEIDVGWLFHWREYDDLSYFYMSDYSPLILLLSSDHDLAHCNCVTWEDLHNLHLVAPGEKDPFTNLVKALCAERGFIPEFAMYTTENNLIANMIDRNAAAILLRKNYYRAIMQFCRNATFVPIDPKVEVANSLIISKKNRRNAALMDFVSYMLTYFRYTMGLGSPIE
ncbi:MAG: LysR family transcriptional regulator, partial [Oscillospiraceae bacterium]|nr:LysR family transcriptional regulator [Oscillospiraceae bacterium]